MIGDTSFNFYLIRHGQSKKNAIKTDITVGQTSDEELTENGKYQAELLGEKFFSKFDKKLLKIHYSFHLIIKEHLIQQ